MNYNSCKYAINLPVLWGEAINIEDELQQVPCTAPCIIGFGDSIVSASDFGVVIEKKYFPYVITDHGTSFLLC